ncbi:MAG: DUF6899 family protein [Nitrososphaerales archaeon]
MPYIPCEARLDITSGKRSPKSPGELNFVIMDLILNYLFPRGHNYTNFNEVIGVLESVKQEFYRRMVAPYEDMKKQIEGDVF